MAIVGILEVDLSTPVSDTRSGLLEALRDGGFKAGENARFIRRNAEVREQPLGRLARELLDDEKAGLVLALSTEALKAAMEASSDTATVFAMSGDPFAVGAGRTPEDHRPNVTGAIAWPPDRKIVELARRLLPQMARLGILFDPTEPDSASSAQRARAAAVEGFLAPLAAPADARGAGAAARLLIEQGAQAIYVTQSVALDKAFPEIIEAAVAARVPVFAASASLAAKGALATYEVDWKEHGRRAGALALRVLRGEKPAGIPMTVETPYQLTLNQKAADRLGLTLHADVLAEAKRVIR